MKVHNLGIAMLVCALVCGCARHNAEPSRHEAIAPDPVDPAPETYALGVTVTADGSVPKDAAVDAFPRGRDVFLSIDVSGAHIEQTIEVKWLDAAGHVVRREIRNVPIGAQYAAFASGGDVTAAPGNHHTIVVINGRVVNEKTFRVL